MKSDVAVQDLGGITVEVLGAGPALVEVTRTVGAAGGEIVPATSDEPVAARVVVLDGATSPRSGRLDPVAGEVPTVLVVGPVVAPVEAARSMRALGGSEAVAWGRDGAGDLLVAALRACVASGDPAPATRGQGVVGVGGASGGVGTTTVASALAAWTAWCGASTLLVVRDAVPGVPCVGVDALATPAALAAATDVPGVRGLRRLTCRDADAHAVRRVGVPAVVDLGVDADADVLVVRRDAAGLAATRATAAARLLVRASGPLAHRVVVRTAGPLVVGVVPEDPRVARAAVLGRVPAGLPGAWLREVAAAAGLPHTGRGGRARRRVGRVRA